MAVLKIQISAIYNISKSSPEGEIISRYIKRIPWSLSITQLEVKGKLPPIKQKECEGKLLLKSIPYGSFVIALDEVGKSFTSEEFSLRLERVTRPICFIIGGAHGLSSEVRDKADMLLSLSDMTLPHVMARVVLIEQIYRAYTISANHPYHK
ncbi:MAG: 23S rRNA (pseudouridine(1915)-N(3))-methyltransferase RlmH [Rickettsiales bacterium]|jgi:23S rRNA (pseudouridine1915-N3)-methyltransferase|nr:23S rRNA (pseudouridine(1915)-N(3))-methyltransferase RlmH [Rickettsiales bacterium]